LQEKILNPLGMKNTQFSIYDSMKNPDHALPYVSVNGEPEEINFRYIFNIIPAGGINSNVGEMANWTLMHLNQGSFGGNQVIEKDQVEQLHTVFMPMPFKDSFNSWFPFMWELGYGLGWAIGPYKGHKVVMHPGNLDGFSSLTLLLPHDHISIVLLVNLDGTYLPFSVAFYVIDVLLGYQPNDWDALYLEMAKEDALLQEQQWEQIMKAKHNGTHPSHLLQEYVGNYVNPAFGVVSIGITTDQSALTVTYFDSINSTLDHWQYDIFAAVYYEYALFFNFQTDDVSGVVIRVDIPFESNHVKPQQFHRMYMPSGI